MLQLLLREVVTSETDSKDLEPASFVNINLEVYDARLRTQLLG